MGAFASSPIDAVRVERRTSQGSCKWRAAVAEMQGWRITHEDAHFLETGQEGSRAFFGVLDGHGGKKAAGHVPVLNISPTKFDQCPEG
ncbi:putative protein phosphatase 2C 21 [Symbiodinium microadriaticum]|uniref:PPM-type phosphatase domain-containing protein n=1 Tax=Symbiodinium microadriaticum TaxID=2951 RepID=A0A1Q9E894_SYMMI|nr:putative protein phosphatase 2C 21 [Symbiodinium microadriaticum]